MSNIKSFKESKVKNSSVLNQSLNKNYKYYIFLVLIILLTILVFSNSTNNNFINYDDNVYVYNNQYIKDFSPHGISEIFKAYFKDELPVTLLTFAVDYKFWKLYPVPYHIQNIIIHLLNIILVFILIRKVTGKPEVALITGLLFAVHPLRTESVVWIAERKDMLFGFFYLASLIFYVNYIKSGNKNKFIVLSLLSAGLSVLSKFSAVTLPLVLFLFDYYYSRPFKIRLLLEKIPFFILPAVSGIIHFTMGQNIQLVGKYLSSFNYFDSMMFAGYSIFFYLNKFFIPVNLSALHSYPVKINGLLPGKYYLCFIVIIIMAAAVVILIRKSGKLRKELIFGTLFFIITISIVLQLVPFGGWVVVAERYTYIPYLGLFFLAAQLYSWISRNIINLSKQLRSLLAVFFTAYIVIFCMLTFERNKIWKNSITLFTDVIEKDSTVYFAYNNRGFAKFENGDLAGALADFNKTLKINPDFIDAYNNHGNLMNNMGNFSAAVEDFNRVIEKNPGYSAAYNNRGNSKVGLKAYAGSIEDYSKAIEINPGYAIAYNNRGSVLCNNMNDFTGAINDFNKAIGIDKLYGQAYFNRGVCYLNLRDLNNACPDFFKASSLGYSQADEFIGKYCNRN